MLTFRRFTARLLVALAILVSGASTGYAQTSAAAEALFREGRELMKAGKLDEACAKLEQSHKIEPKPGTLLNLAVCNEKRGRIATAWANFSSAATLAKRVGQADREAFANERAAALEPRVATVTVTASAVPLAWW